MKLQKRCLIFFRMILVVYSGLGLVVRGSINLEVSNILYWIFFVTYLVIFLFIYSPTMGITEAEGMCLNTSWFTAKQWQIGNFSMALNSLLIVISEKMKRKSIRKQCANMTHFAALGGTRRRHVFSRAETRNYFCILFAILLFQEFTLTMFLKQEILDRKSAAILYYVMLSLILVFWFALFLPMQHLAKSFQRFP